MDAIKIRHLIVAIAVCVFSAWVLARPAGAKNRLIRIVALGDSLTAGYGQPAADAFSGPT